MIIDSSAIVALVMKEPQWKAVESKMAEADALGIAAPTLVESGIVLSARCNKDMRALLSRLIDEAGIEIIPFGKEHYSVAIGAWFKFGKGRHKAALNFGDCISYAVAHTAKLPLLCMGEDFTQTDLALA